MKGLEERKREGGGRRKKERKRESEREGETEKEKERERKIERERARLVPLHTVDTVEINGLHFSSLTRPGRVGQLTRWSRC